MTRFQVTEAMYYIRRAVGSGMSEYEVADRANRIVETSRNEHRARHIPEGEGEKS